MKTLTETPETSFTFRIVHLILTWVLASAALTLTAAELNPIFERHAAERKFRALRWMNENGEIAPDAMWRALEHRRQALRDFGASRDAAGTAPSRHVSLLSAPLPAPQTAGIPRNGWTWLGPGNIGGRVRAIVIHPRQTNILWCGSVAGGIWKSTNSGASWFPLDDFMANLTVACMVMDPANPDVIYAGTGEGFFTGDSIRGAGVFRTSDGGAMWTQLASTANSSFQYVNRLAIDPNNSQVILAATHSGIFRSEDGGQTWTRSYTTETLDVAFHPTDSSQCIAAGFNGRALYSINGGMNWSVATGLPAVSGILAGLVELAYSRSSPSIVFASMDNSSGEVFRSTDGGHSYQRRNTGSHYLEGQGWFCSAIWVDPTDANSLIVGGRELWRSTDGGAKLTRISQWFLKPLSPHEDQHVIVSSPAFDGRSVKTVYFGNDGGVYRAADVYGVSEANGWEDLNHDLGITQFYGGAGNADTGVIIGGTQDNFTLRYSPRQGVDRWTQMFSGDGGFCAADPTDPNYFYGEFVRLQIHRSTNGGLFSDWLQPIFQSVTSGITEAGNPDVNFIAPFILDPNNANTMLAGGSSLWRSRNIKALKPTWSRIKSAASSPVSAIAVAAGNSDIIWVGQNNGAVYSTTNGTAANPTWSRRDLGTPILPKRLCGRITIDPVNSNRVYVAFGGSQHEGSFTSPNYTSANVWRTSDSGSTWTNIHGNLPPAPVNSLVIAPWDSSTLYVGTEVGVYATTDGGANWSTSNDGPSNVAVDELFWLGPKLVAVTHGRGMFYAIPNPGPVSPANLAIMDARISGGNGNGTIDPNECNQLNLVLKNLGGSVASNVTAVLTTETPGVSVIQGYSKYADLGLAETRTNSTPFLISTSPTFDCRTPVLVRLNLNFSGGTNAATFTLPNTSQTYIITQTTAASIVPGTDDIGSHAIGTLTTIPLPFAYSFYGDTFTNATIYGGGSIHFLNGNALPVSLGAIGCVPDPFLNESILAFSDPLRTDTPGSGIFTSISGSAPHRIFNIEWRTTYFTDFVPPSQDKGKPVNFEVRLYEDQPRFDIIYGELNGDGSTAGVGVQQSPDGPYTSFECHTGGLGVGLQLAFQLQQTCADGGGICPPENGSPLILSPTLAGAEFSFAFETLRGKDYVVEYKDSLTDPTWQNWQTVLGDGSAKAISSPVLGARQRFYRLRLR